MSSSSSPPLSIPLISLSPSKPATVLAEEVSNACKTSGFLYITDHGIPQEQIDRAFQISAQFFEGEEQNEKEKVGITIGNKGVSDHFACWTGQYLALEDEELCAGRRRREKEKVEGEIRAFRFELTTDTSSSPLFSSLSTQWTQVRQESLDPSTAKKFVPVSLFS